MKAELIEFRDRFEIARIGCVNLKAKLRGSDTALDLVKNTDSQRERLHIDRTDIEKPIKPRCRTHKN